MHEALSAGIALFGKHQENLGKSAAVHIIKLAAVGAPPTPKSDQAAQASQAGSAKQAAQAGGYDLPSYLKDLSSLLLSYLGVSNYDLDAEMKKVEGKSLDVAMASFGFFETGFSRSK